MTPAASWPGMIRGIVEGNTPSITWTSDRQMPHALTRTVRARLRHRNALERQLMGRGIGHDRAIVSIVASSALSTVPGYIEA